MSNAAGGAAGGPDEEEGEGVVLTELEELQMNMNKTTDESLESTRRMLALAEESQAVGSKTMGMLDAQGEQLDRIEEGMDQINQDMKDAEKNLEGMEKCCGLCVLPWKRRSLLRAKNFEKSGEYANTWKGNDDGAVNADGPRMRVGDEAMMSGNYVTRITKDAREEEMENNISEVSGMVGNLRNMAIDMNTEINTQNRQIGRIGIKGASNQSRIESANKRADKLLKD